MANHHKNDGNTLEYRYGSVASYSHSNDNYTAKLYQFVYFRKQNNQTAQQYHETWNRHKNNEKIPYLLRIA